jgi:hypothetical protein
LAARAGRTTSLSDATCLYIQQTLLQNSGTSIPKSRKERRKEEGETGGHDIKELITKGLKTSFKPKRNIPEWKTAISNQNFLSRYCTGKYY